MAVTKTHPIKSTLKAAIDYICNPDKTDGKLLVSSFGCTAETADIEFAWTRRHAIDKGTNLGRHLIQAFEPGEVMPEEAHRIGMELAREVLGGKYEFVLTTHIDRDHVHNHLIFNAVSFQDLHCDTKRRPSPEPSFASDFRHRKTDISRNTNVRQSIGPQEPLYSVVRLHTGEGSGGAWHTSRQFSLPLHSLVVPCVLPLIFPSRASVRP